MTITESPGPHGHAGAQAERRQRACRRQQDRAGGRPGQRRPGRRGPDAGRDPHDQRVVRRRHHRRAGPAVDPDGRGDDRRGAAVLPAGRTPAGGLHRQGGPQPGRHVVQPVGRARSRRGPDRRRHGPVRQGQRPQARLRDRRRGRPPLRVLRAAHGLRPLPAPPPVEPARGRDAAVLPAAGRVRARAEPRRGDPVLPADVVAGLPAEQPDAVQLRHPAHADVVVLPRRQPARRPRLDLRALRAGGQAVEVRRRHRDRLLPGALARRADPRHQRPVQRHRAVPAHPRLVGLRGQPGRSPQGRRLRLPRAVAPRRRGVPRAPRQHRRGRAPHPQPQPRPLGAGRVHAPRRGRRRLVADRPRPGARAARPVGCRVRRGLPPRRGGGPLRPAGQGARALREDDAHAGADRQRLDDLQGRQQPHLQPDPRHPGRSGRPPVQPLHRDHRGLLRRRDRGLQPGLDQPRPAPHVRADAGHRLGQAPRDRTHGGAAARPGDRHQLLPERRVGRLQPALAPGGARADGPAGRVLRAATAVRLGRGARALDPGAGGDLPDGARGLGRPGAPPRPAPVVRRDARRRGRAATRPLGRLARAGRAVAAGPRRHRRARAAQLAAHRDRADGDHRVDRGLLRVHRAAGVQPVQARDALRRVPPGQRRPHPRAQGARALDARGPRGDQAGRGVGAGRDRAARRRARALPYGVGAAAARADRHGGGAVGVHRPEPVAQPLHRRAVDREALVDVPPRVEGRAQDDLLPALASRDADPADDDVGQRTRAPPPTHHLSDDEALACSLENPENCEACQ